MITKANGSTNYSREFKKGPAEFRIFIGKDEGCYGLCYFVYVEALTVGDKSYTDSWHRSFAAAVEAADLIR